MAAAGAAEFVNEIGDDGKIKDKQDEFGDRRAFEELVDLERQQ